MKTKTEVFDLEKELTKRCKTEGLHIMKSPTYSETYFIRDEDRVKTASQVYMLVKDIIEDCDATPRYGDFGWLIISEG